MRCRRATPYPDTAALQTNTATNPRKTLLAMERRIDLHSSAHAQASALSCSRDRLRRGGVARPHRRGGGGPLVGGAPRAGGGGARGRSRRPPRARGGGDGGG